MFLPIFCDNHFVLNGIKQRTKAELGIKIRGCTSTSVDTTTLIQK
jgi:hypothetical protein